MTTPESPPNGSGHAVLAVQMQQALQGLAEIKTELVASRVEIRSIAEEQIRAKAQAEGFATKLEVQPTVAQAAQAHIRLDRHALQIGKLEDDVAAVQTERATSRRFLGVAFGAASLVGPVVTALLFKLFGV